MARNFRKEGGQRKVTVQLSGQERRAHHQELNTYGDSAESRSISQGT